MKKRYNIENVDIYQLSEESKITISGWALNKENTLPDFDLYVNGIKTEFEIAKMPRWDVIQNFELDRDSLYCGFRIAAETKENIAKLRLIKKDKGLYEEILLLKGSALEKTIKHYSVRYSLDGFIKLPESNMGLIEGWAFSFYNEPVYVYIIDQDENKVDMAKEVRLRKELVDYKYAKEGQENCGFSIKFPYSDSLKYYLVIESGEFRKVFDIAKINKVSLATRMKRKASKINRKNIKRGFTYLRKRGAIQTVKRLFKGPANTNYDRWFREHRVTNSQLDVQRQTHFAYEPKISIIVPTYNTPINFLKEMIDTVKEQSYSNWELCIADGSNPDNEARKVILDYAKKDERIKVTLLDENYGISGNTNKALEIANGDYVGLYDHDDIFELDCLYEIVASLQDDKHDIIYTDEDKYNNDMELYVDPNIKPDWSPDLFYSHNYITHFFVVKTDIIKGVGGFDSTYDGAQDYDIMFKCIEKARSIYHLPKIVYHWRMHAASTAENPESKMYCYEAGQKAIQAHYDRVGIDATVEMMPKPFWGMYHTIYHTKGNPLVSIIIPNMDHKDVLKTCVDSLYKVNTYQNFELIIVENNSKEKDTFSYYQELKTAHNNVKIVKWEKEFNYSLINNFGVTYASGDYILFLNNDTQVITPTAISEMLGNCMRDDVGIVGAKLLYEDDTIQHAGVVIGFGGYAGHIFNGNPADDYGFTMRAIINNNYSAVTAACLMTKRSVFDLVGGFEEQFRVACNDVDFCLKVRKAGYLVVYNAFSIWHHFESKSRGYENNAEKVKRYNAEVAKFRARWPEILEKGDPYYSPLFDIKKAPFDLKE